MIAIAHFGIAGPPPPDDDGCSSPFALVARDADALLESADDADSCEERDDADADAAETEDADESEDAVRIARVDEREDGAAVSVSMIDVSSYCHRDRTKGGLTYDAERALMRLAASQFGSTVDDDEKVRDRSIPVRVEPLRGTLLRPPLVVWRDPDHPSRVLHAQPRGCDLFRVPVVQIDVDVSRSLQWSTWLASSI